MARKWQEREGTVEAGLDTMTQEDIVEQFLRCALPSDICSATECEQYPWLLVARPTEGELTQSVQSDSAESRLNGTGLQPSALQTVRCQALLPRRLWAVQLFPQPAPEAPANWHTASSVAGRSICCFQCCFMILRRRCSF